LSIVENSATWAHQISAMLLFHSQGIQYEQRQYAKYGK
jgi:hypothetical protein